MRDLWCRVLHRGQKYSVQGLPRGILARMAGENVSRHRGRVRAQSCGRLRHRWLWAPPCVPSALPSRACLEAESPTATLLSCRWGARRARNRARHFHVGRATARRTGITSVRSFVSQRFNAGPRAFPLTLSGGDGLLGAVRATVVRISQYKAASDSCRADTERELGPATRGVGAPLSRPGARKPINDRLALVAGLLGDPGEPQLVSPRSLRGASTAKSKTYIVNLCGIKCPRLPECFNPILGAKGRGSFHNDLGFLFVGLVALTLSIAWNR